MRQAIRERLGRLSQTPGPTVASEPESRESVTQGQTAAGLTSRAERAEAVCRERVRGATGCVRALGIAVALGVGCASSGRAGSQETRAQPASEFAELLESDATALNATAPSEGVGREDGAQYWEWLDGARLKWRGPREAPPASIWEESPEEEYMRILMVGPDRPWRVRAFKQNLDPGVESSPSGVPGK